MSIGRIGMDFLVEKKEVSEIQKTRRFMFHIFNLINKNQFKSVIYVQSAVKKIGEKNVPSRMRIYE